MDPRTAVVIGASSPGGLGEASARRLAADGYAVVIAGRAEAPLAALASDIGGKAMVCDVLKEEAIAGLIDAVGPFDVLVNAAGTTDAGRLSRITREAIEAQYSVHVTANMLLLKHAARMIRPGGSIVLFSSLTARVAGQGLAAYGCAKAALDHLVRIAALEFGEADVRVNAVAPGFSPTPMTAGIFAVPSIRDLYLGEAIIGGRAVSADEVASAVAWLAGTDCFATGEIIHLSGGAQLGRLPRLSQLKQARS
jgi:NAD(P)-dependent dehydrogenase (short-subunit alcohol dehydrogenase family)